MVAASAAAVIIFKILTKSLKGFYVSFENVRNRTSNEMWHFEILKKESRALENTFFTSQKVFFSIVKKKRRVSLRRKGDKMLKKRARDQVISTLFFTHWYEIKQNTSTFHCEIVAISNKQSGIRLVYLEH